MAPRQASLRQSLRPVARLELQIQIPPEAPPRLGALRVRSATPLSLHDGGPIPQRVGTQHPARRVGAILDHLSHHGPDVYLTCSTCPRISPSGNFAVWMLMYHLPASRSASC